MEKTDFERFSVAMKEASVATRSEINDVDLKIFFSRFESTSIEDFELAIARASDASNYFPSTHRIRECIPVKRTTIDVIEERTGGPYQPFTAICEEPSNRGPSEIEERMDSMTIEELTQAFIPIWHFSKTCYTQELKRQAATRMAENFDRNRQSAMYRPTLRDILMGNWNPIENPA